MEDPKTTTVTLLSKTENIMETIYVEWMASRSEEPVPLPSEVASQIRDERLRTLTELFPGQFSDEFGPDGIADADLRKAPVGPFERNVRKVAEDCINMRVPIAETVDFVFLIDHCPIALREQMVRHRVGHKFGSRLGADLIPDIADSSWWAQTMRATDMTQFARKGEYLEPEWIRDHGDEMMPGFHPQRVYPPEKGPPGDPNVEYREVFNNRSKLTIREFYRNQMHWIAAAYRRLLDVGMPPEDARNIIPLGANQRLTWKMNLSALMHVLSKRGCWIAQLGMWEPVIRGLVDELATKVDPIFRNLIDPPCIGADGRFASCKFHKENAEYIAGRDPHFPCPLWLHRHQDKLHDAIADADDPRYLMVAVDRGVTELHQVKPLVTASVESDTAVYFERVKRYESLWMRDSRTGERFKVS